MQYYRGKISNGEMVVLDREPTNPYDSNAIRASNVAHAQVGSLPTPAPARPPPPPPPHQLQLQPNPFPARPPTQPDPHPNPTEFRL